MTLRHNFTRGSLFCDGILSSCFHLPSIVINDVIITAALNVAENLLSGALNRRSETESRIAFAHPLSPPSSSSSPLCHLSPIRDSLHLSLSLTDWITIIYALLHPISSHAYIALLSSRSLSHILSPQSRSPLPSPVHVPWACATLAALFANHLDACARTTTATATG